MAETQRKKVPIFCYIDSELRDIAAADCAKRNVNLNDIVAELLADFYKRPDLRLVPRKRIGRPFGAKLGTKKKGKK